MLGRVESEFENSRVPEQPVLDYQDVAGENSERARRRWSDLRNAAAAGAPGCLVVTAVVIIMLVYGLIAIAVLFSDS